MRLFCTMQHLRFSRCRKELKKTGSLPVDSRPFQWSRLCSHRKRRLSQNSETKQPIIGNVVPTVGRKWKGNSSIRRQKKRLFLHRYRSGEEFTLQRKTLSDLHTKQHYFTPQPKHRTDNNPWPHIFIRQHNKNPKRTTNSISQFESTPGLPKILLQMQKSYSYRCRKYRYWGWYSYWYWGTCYSYYWGSCYYNRCYYQDYWQTQTLIQSNIDETQMPTNTNGLNQYYNIHLMKMADQQDIANSSRRFKGAVWARNVCFSREDANSRYRRDWINTSTPHSWEFSSTFIDEMVGRYGQEYNFGLPEYRAQSETLVDPQRILSK